jgi:hypothetical protein
MAEANLFRRYLPALLCFLAALRVWLYASAFPFFSNVDEGQHIDMVIRYARGEVSRGLQPMLVETNNYFALCQSPEYLFPLESCREAGFRPWWKKGLTKKEGFDMWVYNAAAAFRNHEMSQPPLYYAIAGMWYRLGLNFSDKEPLIRLYWIRFLNVILVTILVWFAYMSARELFPGDHAKILSLTALVALLPQDTFYTVQNDVLSPVCFSIAFYLCLRFLRAGPPTARLALWLGLATASTVLVKLSNLPLILIVTAVVGYKLTKASGGISRNRALRAGLTFLLTAWIPLLSWFGLNIVEYGDLTGAGIKMEAFGWTYKPMGEWLSNSLFTFGGFSKFWTTLWATFWKGELIFHNAHLTLPAADIFYWVSSSVFLVFAFFARGDASDRLRRLPADPVPIAIGSYREAAQAWILTVWSLLSLLLFLIVLSLGFDYGNCGYPSRVEPFFTSGRLISAGLVPFAALYVRGFYFIFSPLMRKYAWCLFVLILAFVTVSEAVVSAEVFRSEYNFLHL